MNALPWGILATLALSANMVLFIYTPHTSEFLGGYLSAACLALWSLFLYLMVKTWRRP